VQPVSQLIAWLAVGALIATFRANYTDRIFHLGNVPFGITVVMATMVTVNVIADLLLIPKFGAVGCAMASVIAATVSLVHGTWASRKVMRLPFPKRDAAKIAAATGLMALFLWPFYGETGVLVLLIQIVGGMVVFGAVVLAADVMGLRGRVLERVRAGRRH
jgi:peptidoglycan biosynthesis protein MviN/MurJ (putative lipid II flippase)